MRHNDIANETLRFSFSWMCGEKTFSHTDFHNSFPNHVTLNERYSEKGLVKGKTNTSRVKAQIVDFLYVDMKNTNEYPDSVLSRGLVTLSFDKIN